jgi:hypothetical protein
MSVFAIHSKPGAVTSVILSWFLFIGGVGLYFYVALQRHLENPEAGGFEGRSIAAAAIP